MLKHLRDGNRGRSLALGISVALSTALIGAACSGSGGDSRPSAVRAGDTEAAAPSAPESSSGETAAPETAPPQTDTEQTPAATDGSAASASPIPTPAAGAGAAPKSPTPKANTAKGTAPAKGTASANTAEGAGAGQVAPAKPAQPSAAPGVSTPGPGTPAPGAAPATGGASDVGITKDSIKLGQVMMLGIAMANLFIHPTVRSNQATVESLNDAGGVYGRRYSQIVTCDDGAGDLARGKACVKKLAEEDKVFVLSYVQSWSSAGIHDDLARYGLPLVGSWSYSHTEWEDPFMFPTHMSMLNEATAGAVWARDVIKPKTYGLLCLNSPEMQQSCKNVRAVLDAAGAKLVLQTNMDLNEADMSSEVIAMRAADPDHIIHYVLWPSSLAKWITSAGQQGYWPKKGMSGNHLAAEVLGSVWGDWPAGRYWTNTTYPLWGKSHYAINEKYAPGNHGNIHHITQSGYVGLASVLHPALQKVGPEPTRKKLMDVLNQGEWSTDPDLDQKWMYTPGKRYSPGTGSCREFMYKYVSKDTTAKGHDQPNGFQPDPDMYEIVIPADLCANARHG